MSGRLSRISQLFVAVTVAAGILFVDLVSYGPDIDGRTAPLLDTIQMGAIEGVIILAFALSAICLFRRPKVGWWSSIVIDSLLFWAAVSMMSGDFSDRFVATQAGRDAFRGDLVIHGTILVLCAVAFGLLIVERKQYLTNTPN